VVVQSKSMQYNRVIIAKVALGVASEDEVFWVDKCQHQSAKCAEAVVQLRELASVPATYECMEPMSLIEAGDTHKVSSRDQDHLMECNRCARIGQYISTMPFPSSKRDPISLSA